LVTISKLKSGRIGFFRSIRFKFVLSYIALLAVLLAVLNIYPPAISKNLVFSSKQASMQNQLSVISSSLSGLEKLTKENVAQSLTVTDALVLMRVIVLDSDAMVLYDSDINDSRVDKYMLSSEVKRALAGNNVFHSALKSGAFVSKAACPIRNSGKTTGALYIYEYDTEQASIVTGVQKNMSSVSVIVITVSLLIFYLLSKLFTDRTHTILAAIKHVSDGQYGYSMEIHGQDELSQLGMEFNDLSDRLKSTEDMRRRFVSDASHELKTPLASIRLLSDSIVQNEDMDPQTIREFVSDIGNEAERLTRTSEKMLSLTRLDARVPPVSVPLADVSATVTRVLRMLEPLAAPMNVRLTSDLSPDCFVRVTEDDLYAIIFNLVENAIKYNVKGGSVNVMVYAHNSLVRIIIDDTGIGIPEEDIPHIFDRFYRVDKARSREAGGSGLGLSIVRDTVLSFGGTVEVSRRTQGTRFRVCFPQARPEEEEA